MQNKLFKYGFIVIMITVTVIYMIVNPENKQPIQKIGAENSISYKPKTETFNFNTKLVLNGEEVKFNANFENNFENNRIMIQSLKSLNPIDFKKQNIDLKYLGNHSYVMKGEKEIIKNVIKSNNFISSKFQPIISFNSNVLEKKNYIIEYISSNDKKEVFDSIDNIVKNNDVFSINLTSPKNRLYGTVITNLEKPLAFTPESQVNNFDILTKHGVSPLNYSDDNNLYNLTGKNVKVLVVDGGAVRNDHIEFVKDDGSSKVMNVTTQAIHYHPTHVSGTIVATGKLKESTGMAPDASIVSEYYNTSTFPQRLADAKSKYGINLSNHSYGYYIDDLTTTQLQDYLGIYNYDSKMADDYIYNNPNIIVVKSSGNDRKTANVVSLRGTNGYQMITAEGLSKNTITVNALNKDADVFAKTGTIADFGNTGPVSDGRIKPEISAIGVDVVSPYSESTNQYVYMSGTSMASPAITGMIALITEEYNNLNQSNPLSVDLVKALMINNSVDLGRAGPDYEFGFGMPNMKDTIDTLKTINDNDDSLIYRGTIADKEVLYLPVRISGNHELKLTVNWIDYAANISSFTLVNDLDIEIVDLDDNVLSYPYSLDKNNPTALATKTTANKVDNTEQIIVNLPAGDYILKIKGTSVFNGSASFSVVANHAVYRPMLKESYLGLIAAEEYALQMNSIISDLETQFNASKSERNNLTESSSADVQSLIDTFTTKKSDLNTLLTNQEAYYTSNGFDNYTISQDKFNSFLAMINSYLTYLNTEISNMNTILDNLSADENQSLSDLITSLNTLISNYTTTVTNKTALIESMSQLVLNDLNTMKTNHESTVSTYNTKLNEIITLKDSLISKNILSSENTDSFTALSSTFDTFTTKVNTYTSFLTDLITNIDDINTKLTTRSNKVYELNNLIASAKSLNQQYIDAYSDTTGKYTTQINSIESNVIENKISLIDTDLDTLNTNITDITSIINEIKTLVDNYNTQTALQIAIDDLKKQIEEILYTTIGFEQNNGGEVEAAYTVLINSGLDLETQKATLETLLTSLNALVEEYKSTITQLESSIQSIITELSLDQANQYVITFNEIKNNTSLNLLQDSTQLAELLVQLEAYKYEIQNGSGSSSLTEEQKALVTQINELAATIVSRLSLLDPANEDAYLAIVNLWLNDTSLNESKILETDLVTLRNQLQVIISSLDDEYKTLTNAAKYNWERLITYNNTLIYNKQFIESQKDAFYDSVVALIEENISTINLEVIAENNATYLTQIEKTLTMTDEVKAVAALIREKQKLIDDVNYYKNRLIAYNDYLLNLVNLDSDFKNEYPEFYSTVLTHTGNEDNILGQLAYTTDYLTTLKNEISVIYEDIVQGRIYVAELSAKKRALAQLEYYKGKMLSYANHLEYYMDKYSFTDYFPTFYSDTMSIIAADKAAVDNYTTVEDVETVKTKVNELYTLIVEMRVKINEIRTILAEEAKRVKTIGYFTYYQDRLKSYADYLENLVNKYEAIDASYVDYYTRAKENIGTANEYYNTQTLSSDASIEVAQLRVDEVKTKVIEAYDLIKEGRLIASEIYAKIRLINYYVSLSNKLNYYGDYLNNLINNVYDIKERGYTEFWNRATTKINEDKTFISNNIPTNDFSVMQSRIDELTDEYLNAIKLRISEEYELIKEGRTVVSTIANIIRQERDLETYKNKLAYYDQYLIDLVTKYEALDLSYSEYYNRVRASIELDKTFINNALTVDKLEEAKTKVIEAYTLIKEGREIAYAINTIIRLQNYSAYLQDQLKFYTEYLLKYTDLYSVQTKDVSLYNTIIELTNSDTSYLNGITKKDVKEDLDAEIETLKEKITNSYSYIVTVRTYR